MIKYVGVCHFSKTGFGWWVRGHNKVDYCTCDPVDPEKFPEGTQMTSEFEDITEWAMARDERTAEDSAPA